MRQADLFVVCGNTAESIFVLGQQLIVPFVCGFGEVLGVSSSGEERDSHNALCQALMLLGPSNCFSADLTPCGSYTVPGECV